MPPEKNYDQNELQLWIEMLLDRGYTMSQIENILGVKINVRTVKVQVIEQVFRTQSCGEFGVNMN